MKFAYVGCRTTKKRNARGKGLVVYEIGADGSWTEKQTLFVEDNPSYQCLDQTGNYLYSVHGDLTLASSYKIAEDGTLVHLNTIDIGGKNPVDITVDRENRNVLIATLQGGTVYTVRRNPDGSLGEILAKYTYEGKEDGRTPGRLSEYDGIVPEGSKVSTIHQCYWDRNRNYIFSAAQGRVNGYGQLRALRYDPATGRLSQTDRFMARTWDEPRHVAMHPNNRWLYLCEEKGDKVIFIRFDETTGSMTPLQELSTVPETITSYSDASEVMVDQSGEWVLVSNRYTDSIAVYRIDPLTGYLHTNGFYPCLGKTPRFFCFAPNGKCYVANEDSDTIVEFSFDPVTGVLTPTLNIIHTGSPVCITFRG
jgi:6-phosphogluconolactonase